MYFSIKTKGTGPKLITITPNYETTLGKTTPAQAVGHLHTLYTIKR
jgi:hypothetical protein